MRLVAKGEALQCFRQQLDPNAGILEGHPLPNALEVFLMPGGEAAAPLGPRS